MDLMVRNVFATES